MHANKRLNKISNLTINLYKLFHIRKETLSTRHRITQLHPFPKSKNPPKLGYPIHNTKIYPMVRFHFWSSDSVEYLFINITLRSTETRNVSTYPSLVYWLNMYKNCSYLIKPFAKKHTLRKKLHNT